MSDAGNRKTQNPPVGQKRTVELGLDALTDRFHGMLRGEKNKPDSKDMDLGSPVSPLRTQIPATSSSSSSGSFTGKPAHNQRQGSNSGELSGSSGGSSGGGGGGGSSPTAESVRLNTARSVRTGNILRPSPPPGNAAPTPDPAMPARPGHCRVGSTDGFPATKKPGLITGSSSGGHARSNSGPIFPSPSRGNSAPPPMTHSPLAGSGNAAVNSPPQHCPSGNILPSGNIVPSGKIGICSKTTTSRSDVLGSGTANYGHGSIMRGMGKSSGDSKMDPVAGNIQFAGESIILKRSLASTDPDEVKRAGNEWYKKGHFAEALCLYDRAISLSPGNAACRSNRAAALMALDRLPEAIRECEEAVKLDPSYGRAHQRLASLHLRLGQVEISRKHLCFTGQVDSGELLKLQTVEKHLSRCSDARKIGDWKSALREGDSAIAAGADSSPQLFASRAESMLKLHQLVEADSALSNVPKFEPYPPSWKFFGMAGDSYLFFVRAQVEMALGRFENAVSAAEKAGQIDPRNIEVSAMLHKVRSVTRARTRGNDLFNSRKFAEACVAYGEGLQFDTTNSVLYCNRAACRFKLGQWESSIEDCNQALRIQPNYTKALLRRAASYGRLEHWAESVRDYEVLRKELPGDSEVAEGLFHAQIALKKSRGEEVYNMKFGGEVEEILDADQFQAAISSPGVSVVLFKVRSNQQCDQISPFVDSLCVRYPSVNFLKVDMDECLAVARAENVRIAPTFKIYKNGNKVKEMICPSHQVLEYSVRHYSL